MLSILSPMSAYCAALIVYTRVYTRLLGTLEEGMHHTKYNLAEARVLYELATRTEPKATDVADALAMDPAT